MTGPVTGWRRGAALVPLAALLLPATLAAQDPGQVALLRGSIGVDPEPGSLLSTPARLTVNGLPLAEALSRLSERSHVGIAFSPTLLPEDHRVECDCASLNTARALDQLLAGTGLGYVELGTQIVVVPLAPAEPPPANGTIRGRIRTEVAFPVVGVRGSALTTAIHNISLGHARPGAPGSPRGRKPAGPTQQSELPLRNACAIAEARSDRRSTRRETARPPPHPRSDTRYVKRVTQWTM